MERPYPNPFAKLGIQRAVNSMDSELEHVRIYRAIKSGTENRNIDFKQECYASGKRDHFLNDVCSFANADGGILLLGVQEKKDPPHEVIGICPSDIIKCIKRLSEWTRKYLLPNELGVHIYKYQIENKLVLAVSVRKSTIGPVYYEKDGGHIFKIRGGDGTRDARFDELSKLIKASPVSKLQVQASLLADEFRRQSFVHRSVFIEAFGGEYANYLAETHKEYPIKSSEWKGYSCNGFHFGMITDVEIVHISEVDDSLIPDDVVPMVGDSELGSVGRVPAKSIGFSIYEHDEGSGIEAFMELCERASKLLRQKELELLYQTPSLYGITPTTLNKWVHVLVYAALQHGIPYQVSPAYQNIVDVFAESKLNPRTAFSHRMIQLPGDARVLSARLLDEIAAFV